MKKIFLGVLIVTLPLIAFFQYKSYQRFNPPTDYEYVSSTSIDINYHDKEMIEEYFQKIVELGSFARRQWRNEGIDVRFPAENTAEKNAADYYNTLLSRVREIELRLENSAVLKSEGFSNEQIINIESGSTKNEVKWDSLKLQMLGASIGDLGEHIWVMQQLLIAKGYQHNLDGVFGIDTQNAILSFQRDNQLFPGGVVNETTFRALVN